MRIEDNTVSPLNQVPKDERVYEISGKSPKILILGNSITRHAPNRDIGWNGNWGMAASAIEYDYVHILANKIKEESPDAHIMIMQFSDFEQNWFHANVDQDLIAIGRNFGADILISRIAENITYCDDKLVQAFERLWSVLCKNKQNVIATTCFWKNPNIDLLIEKAAEIVGGELVYLGELGENPMNMAIGQFEHSGVAIHPNDEGMRKIAERIWEKLSLLLGKI